MSAFVCHRTALERPERWASEGGGQTRALRRSATTELSAGLGATPTEDSPVSSALECSVGKDDVSVSLPEAMEALFVFVAKAEDSVK